MPGPLMPSQSRQKCSPRAIGEFWANKTKTEWSWDALRWLSTATTPVLGTDPMLHLMLQEEWHNEAHNPPKPNPAPPPRTLDLSHLPTAPWTRLLAFTNLAPLSRSGPPHLTPTHTLPASLPSVPAHAEVSLLVAALVAAGAHTITVPASSAPYPLLIGSNFQLSFHTHPTLGVVGLFHIYPAFQRVSKVPQPDGSLLGVMHAILHSRGDVRDPETLPQNRRWDLHDMPYEEWEGYNPFQPLSPSVSFADLRRLSHPDWCGRAQAPDTCAHIAQRNDEYGLHWLLYAPLPKCIPAVFPVALSLRSGMDDVLGALALAARKGFWLSPRGGNILGAWAETKGKEVVYVPAGGDGVFPGYVTQRDLEMVGAVWKGEAGVGELAVAGGMRRALEKDWEGMVVIGDVLDQGRGVVDAGWGAFRAWFDGLEGGRGRYFRGLVGVQAKMVGRWLDREVGGMEGGLRRRCELLFGGLMVLGAVPRGGEGGEEGGRKTDWGVKGVVGRFARALGAMESVLEEFEGLVEGVGGGDEEVETCLAMLRTHKHRRRLESLVGRPDSDVTGTGRSRLKHIRRQLDIARGVVDRARSIKEESDFFRSASSGDQGDNSDAHATESKSRDQAVTDMLIWKAILMGMLFWTAPDNSAVLTSGIWESVVPIL